MPHRVWQLCVPAMLLLSGCAMPTRLSKADSGAVAGRTYVVTGASSGFGRGTAEMLGRAHANVVLAARRTDLLEEVAGEIRAAGGNALVVPTDVSRAEDVSRLADAALGRFGRIDVWINNAAVGAIGRFDQIPVQDHARLMAVNVNGVIYGSHAALAQFRRQGFGTLINIGSVESKIPLAYHASYSASKHAVLGLSQAIAQELRLDRQRRIKVVTIMPWAADTPYWQHSANYSGRSPRMVAMDAPEKVARAIVHASIHPRKRIAVGWKAEAAAVSDHILPGLTEHLSANIVHQAQMEAAPPAASTPGSLYEPVGQGRGVEGGNRARIKAEDAAKRAAPAPGPR